nr:MAG TPA: hypothetical protein [Caudoviricetes sp.]
MSRWETLEMVRRYAHLSVRHFTAHASKIKGTRGERSLLKCEITY